MGWKDKLAQVGQTAQDSLGGKADEALAQQMPKIKQLFQEKVGPEAMKLLADDAKMTSYSKVVYELLPGPVRLMVKPEVFTSFCMTHRAKLMEQTLA